jgi:hypothetical protein
MMKLRLALKYNQLRLTIPLLFSLLLMNGTVAFGQGNLVSKLKDLKAMIAEHPLEKIHIQTNQPFYSAGDTLWFKSYVIESSSNLPSSASKTLNVMLVGPSGTLVQHVKTKVQVGLSSGHLHLPATLDAGAYTLQAFTGGMNEYGAAHHFRRTILVKSATDKLIGHKIASSRSTVRSGNNGAERSTKGYELETVSLEDSIQLKIRYTGIAPAGTITIVAAQDGVTRYIKRLPRVAANIQLHVPKSSFYTGVVQFTVLDEHDVAVAEQLTFCNHQAFLNITADVKDRYKVHEPLKVKLNVRNAAGLADVSSLAVSVYNVDAFPADERDESTIFSELLLTSDLNDVPEQPNAYFMDLPGKLQEDKLHEMLKGKKLKRFSWMDKLSRGLPQPARDEQWISGRVLLGHGKPMIAGEVVLVQDGQEKHVYTTKTDSVGHFAFGEPEFYGTVTFLVSSTVKGAKVELDSSKNSVLGTEGKASSPRLAVAEGAIGEQAVLKSNGGKAIELQQVQVKGSNTNAVTSSANLNGPGKADVVILAKDLQTKHDISTYLINRVNGLKIYQGKVYSREIPEEGQMLSPPPPMLLVLDGTMLNQESYIIDEINPNDVQSIEVLKGASAALYGINGMGGVLVITMKRGRDNSSSSKNGMSDGVMSFSRTGFQPPQQFQVKQAEQLRGSIQDKRTVLYWNPDIVSSAEGEAVFEYVNPGYAGKFRLVVEGIDGDGQIGRAVYEYEVN